MAYTKIPIAPKQDFLEKISNTSPIQAICEMIWNGFDAGANVIKVRFATNAIDGIESIEIEDDGCGIDPQKVSTFCGDLGDSWKLTTSRYKGRSLHGKHGTGRYKAFAIGNKVTWKTCFATDDKGIVEYQIVGKRPISHPCLSYFHGISSVRCPKQRRTHGNQASKTSGLRPPALAVTH